MSTIPSVPRHDSWPRLSERWPNAEPGRCASCGAADIDSRPLTTWQEHDRGDQPEERYVILCLPCSKRFIDPHPRLYAAISRHAPTPGAMALCLNCRHRLITRCVNPDAIANGGQGIAIIGPAPSRVHVYRRGPGAQSGWINVYESPPIYCRGAEPRP